MERATLKAEKRETKGKGAARSARRSGTTPAVIYREGKAESIQMNHKELTQYLNSTGGEQTIVNIKFPDNSTRLALIKDYQIHPLRGVLMHADFMEVHMDEAIRVNVPVNLVGEAIGVKRDKGILQAHAREVEIEARPDKVPQHFELDITALETGHALHVRDLAVPEGVKVLTDPAEVIVLVTTALAAETPAEGEAAAATTEAKAAGAEQKAE